MMAMIFEYAVDPDQYDVYVEHAKRMRELASKVEGFVSFERYDSAVESGKILALAFFEDEEAVRRWRNSPEHRKAQMLGRKRFFTDYRLRMAEVKRDYSMDRRNEAPGDSLRIHDRQASG